MCTKCEELDKKIARYNRLSDSIGDLTSINRFREIVWEMEAEKAALHPEEQK